MLCAQLKAFDFGVDVLSIANETGPDMDITSLNSVVRFYAKCGWVQYARQLLKRMPNKDSESAKWLNQ
jgi:pentatricopeptide repeat protein